MIWPLICHIFRVYFNDDFNEVITKEYLNTTEEYFLAKPVPLDFSDGKAASEINEWVKSQTNGKIKDIVSEDLDTNTALILINAIHFKGDWEKTFNNASEGDFHISNNNKGTDHVLITNQ